MTQFGFDVSQYEPFGTYISYPLAKYPVEIVNVTTDKTTTDPTQGKMVLHLKILDGPYSASVFQYMLNLWNKDPTAVDLSRRKLSSVCRVIKRKAQTTEELIGGRFIALIGPQDNDPKYSEVKQIWDLEGNDPAGGVTQPPAAPVTAPPAAPPAAPMNAPAWNYANPAAYLPNAPSNPAAPPSQQPPAWPAGPPAAPSGPPTGWGAPTGPTAPPAAPVAPWGAPAAAPVAPWENPAATQTKPPWAS